MTTTFDPKAHWADLRDAMERGGADAVAGHIAGFEPAEQRALYHHALRAFDGQDWQGKAFGPQIALAERGIAVILEQAEAAEDEKTRAGLTDSANVLAYNLAANLAPCWPGDDRERSPEVFEAGLSLAARCLAWREQLGKGPFPFLLAWWARGVHQLALGRDARESMEATVRATRQWLEAKPDAGPEARMISPEGDAMLLMNEAWAGLAERAMDEQGDSARYDTAMAALRARAEVEEHKEEAQFCIDQLETMAAWLG